MKINSTNLDLNKYNNNSTVINETLLKDAHSNFVSIGTNNNIDRLVISIIGVLILVLLNYKIDDRIYVS
jgi:hypothetical protein